MTIGDTNKIMSPSNECDRCKYTFANEKLKRYTTIDFICLSLSLQSCVTMYTTVESVSCHSDHLPVAISVTLPASFEITKYVNSGHLKTKLSKETNVKKSFNLRWDHGDIDLYYQTTCHMLYPIYNGLTEYYNNFVNVDDVINIHNDNFDMSQLHAIIETCYNQTVCALKSAATSSIRKATSSSFNAWWNSDLSKAEMHSLESHKARVAAGKPRDGELFLLRNKCKLYYKL